MIKVIGGKIILHPLVPSKGEKRAFNIGCELMEIDGCCSAVSSTMHVITVKESFDDILEAIDLWEKRKESNVNIISGI